MIPRKNVTIKLIKKTEKSAASSIYIFPRLLKIDEGAVYIEGRLWSGKYGIVIYGCLPSLG